MINQIELNPQFIAALTAIDEGRNLFITGKAGTGKSTLLQYFRANTKKNMHYMNLETTLFRTKQTFPDGNTPAY